jgi:tripartite-type tricarboxylate transporter receptor subunit TctC
LLLKPEKFREKRMPQSLRTLAAVAGALVLSTLPVGAAEYPNRPITLVVGLAAGGGTDASARLIGEWLSRSLGQRVVIENRPGMGGNLGAQSVIKAPPDGHTLLFAGPNNTIANSLYKRLPFDFLRDTEPVGGVMRLTNLMVVPQSLPVKTVQEFIDHAKANPGKLSVAATGVGTSVHLSGELFKAMTKIDVVHVQYRGSSIAYADLVTGKVHVMFGNMTSVIELVRSGRLRGLGVTSAKRWESLPDIPTIAETIPGYEADVWYGVVAPKGTPPEIIAALNKAINAALADPDMRARFEQQGGIPMPMSPGNFGKMIADDIAKWRKVVEFAGVSVD